MTYGPALVGVAVVIGLTGGACAGEHGIAFTREFPVAECTFRATGNNPYFPLVPGTEKYLSNRQCYEAAECAELEELRVSVLDRTKTIVLHEDGEPRRISTRVVEERHFADGVLVEYSRNYFAECKGSKDVYYFGEHVDIIEDGEVVSHDGAWLAGRMGASPGIIMPGGTFLNGARYFQEIAPGVAQDRAEHLEGDVEIDVPAGAFEDCVRIRETTPLEPGAVSIKIYCPGVGLVVDGDLELETIALP